MASQSVRTRKQIARSILLVGTAVLILLLVASLAAAAPDAPSRMSLDQKATPTPDAPAGDQSGTVSGGVFGGLPIGDDSGGVNLDDGAADDQPADDSSSGGAPDAVGISYGETVDGVIDDTNYVALYAFQGSAGDTITVRMEAASGSDLDPYLGLMDANQNILVEDDDSAGGLNAGFTQTLPSAGVYAIVATRYDLADGTTSGAYTLTLTNAAGSGAPVDFGGDVQVMGASVNDPWTASPLISAGMVVGNTIDDTNWGWAYAIDAQAGQTLTIRMEAVTGSDLDCYLAVVDANENVLAEDDDSGGGTDSQIVFTVPQTGRYYLVTTRYATDTGDSSGAFIMAFTEGAAIEGGAAVSTPDATSAGLDYSLTPTFGSVELVSGFQDDPHNEAIVAGGDVDAAAALGGPCLGYVATAPDFRLNYTAGQYNLRIFFTGESDTTLVINAPDGQWYCDDDSGGNLHPMIDFTPPLDGQYDIWVGSYEAGQLVNGELTITEMDLTPGGSSKSAFSLSDNWK